MLGKTVNIIFRLGVLII